jgi:ribosomal protein L29
MSRRSADPRRDVQGKVKASALRTQSKDEVLKALENAKTELAKLRVAQVASGSQNAKTGRM